MASSSRRYPPAARIAPAPSSTAASSSSAANSGDWIAAPGDPDCRCTGENIRERHISSRFALSSGRAGSGRRCAPMPPAASHTASGHVRARVFGVSARRPVRDSIASDEMAVTAAIQQYDARLRRHGRSSGRCPIASRPASPVRTTTAGSTSSAGSAIAARRMRGPAGRQSGVARALAPGSDMTAAVLVTVDARYADPAAAVSGIAASPLSESPRGAGLHVRSGTPPFTKRLRRLFPFVTWVDVADLELGRRPADARTRREFDCSVMYARWAALTDAIRPIRSDPVSRRRHARARAARRARRLRSQVVAFEETVSRTRRRSCSPIATLRGFEAPARG